MKKILYRVLKKDMIKKLSKKHGEQFIDDVTETFGIPTNLMKESITKVDYIEEVNDLPIFEHDDPIEKPITSFVYYFLLFLLIVFAIATILNL